MKEKLNKQDRQLIERFWKSGFFDINKIILQNKKEEIKKLENLQVLSKLGEFKYRINRIRYLELDKEIIQEELNFKVDI